MRMSVAWNSVLLLQLEFKCGLFPRFFPWEMSAHCRKACIGVGWRVLICSSLDFGLRSGVSERYSMKFRPFLTYSLSCAMRDSDCAVK